MAQDGDRGAALPPEIAGRRRRKVTRSNLGGFENDKGCRGQHASE